MSSNESLEAVSLVMYREMKRGDDTLKLSLLAEFLTGCSDVSFADD